MLLNHNTGLLPVWKLITVVLLRLSQGRILQYRVDEPLIGCNSRLGGCLSCLQAVLLQSWKLAAFRSPSRYCLLH